MANPNIVNVGIISGSTALLSPTTNAASVLLSNPLASNSVFKIDMIQATNVTANTVATTVSINNGAAGTGTPFRLAYQISIPSNASLILIDKSTSFYLTENTSIVVTSTTPSAIDYVCSYETIV